MAGTDSTPDSTQANIAAQDAARAAELSAADESKARMLEVQKGYGDPQLDPEDAEEETATVSQTVETATGDIDWNFLQSASPEQYSEYVDTLTPEQAVQVLRGLPIAGVRSFSKGKTEIQKQQEALALAKEEYQAELQRLAGQFVPPPQASQQEEADGGWVDPQVSELKAKLAQIEAREQQRSVAEGLGAIGSEMHRLAGEHPFFAEMGAAGAQKLFAHMQALNTPNTKVAFKDLFEQQLDTEKEARIVERLNGQHKKAASLPHVAPTGTARRTPTELPRSMTGKKEQMKKNGVGDKLAEFFGLR
jgi:hypothetical protein